MNKILKTFLEKSEKKWEKILRGRRRPSLARSLSASQKTTVLEPLEHHQHIKTEKRSSCRVCSYIRQKISLEQEKKGAIRGANTAWKCTICGPICREASCWNIMHSTGFKGRKRKYDEIAQ